MILYKKFKFSFFIILLMVALFSYPIFINDGLICNFKSGIEKDICFSNLMLNQGRIDILKHIEDDLIRDVSYWTFISKEFGDDLHEKFGDDLHENYDCNLIENTYLRYMCIRLGFRPHMVSFITMGITYSAKNDFDSLLDKCSYYEGNIKLFCIYTNAAIIARYNFSQAIHICNQLNDGMLIGECSFYIASSFAMNIAHKTSKRIDLIMDFCEKIIHPDWKSECYYVLADELALTKPERLEDIAIACRKSNLAGDYGCFDHIEYLLPTEKLLEFCGLTESFNEKVDCFLGFGVTIGLRFHNNLTFAISACNKVPNNFSNYCFDNLGSVIVQNFNGDTDSAISSCNKLPLGSRENCFHTLGESISHFFRNDVNSAIASCNMIPLKFREDCFNSLSVMVGGNSYKNIDLGILSCNKIPASYRNTCLESLSMGAGQHFGDDLKQGISMCNKIPLEFREKCFTSLGMSVIDNYDDDIDTIIFSCNKIPPKFRSGCNNYLGEKIGERFYTDVDKGISSCNKIPLKFRESCFHSMGKNVINYVYGNISLSASLCNKIPLEFRKSCFNGLCKSIGWRLKWDANLKILALNEIPPEFRNGCFDVVDNN